MMTPVIIDLELCFAKPSGAACGGRSHSTSNQPTCAYQPNRPALTRTSRKQ